MDKSDGMDKSWDHPWNTEEMRQKRREWSLAGDAGLLKHLQQFSDNLIAKASQTQEALDSLSTQLNETAILIDNVTNTSLALANTQFIESRVQEDDVEIEEKVENSVQESKDNDLTVDLIASVRQGLNIMDEKYKRMEVIDSDSEEEGDERIPSFILGPNDPYQDRPLPYVIGSDQWKNSEKIGLESSSSESEQADEDEEELDSDKDDAASRIFGMNAIPKINVDRISSSLSESDNYNQRNNITYMDNEKIDGVCQNNVYSTSDSITPTDNVSKASSHISTPNFAEELAKRLGTVRQAQKPLNVDEKNEASINRVKDDLFLSDENEEVFLNKSDSMSSGKKEVLNHQPTANLWKEKPIPSVKSNIIPASIDVPPPISTVSTKPKSSIDDLFADADSEDSDDIFSSKNTVKRISKDNNLNGGNSAASIGNMQKKYLDIVTPRLTTNMATSTPDTNVDTTNLFSDEEDYGDLFGPSKNQRKSDDVSTPSKKIPTGGVSISGNISASDIQNKLLNKVSQARSSESSCSNTPPTSEVSRSNELVRDRSRNSILNDNVNNSDSIVVERGNAENVNLPNETSTSSGISIRPPSVNVTAGSSIGWDFQPQMSSTRLPSEEIYRERYPSDSLFGDRTRNTISAVTTSNSTSNQTREGRSETSSSTRQDDVFENEDLFGPPPLPKADSKASKSKVSSLFDDSDSGDELFSTTSSGSRSQKSTDFLAVTPQYTDKTKSTSHRKGLFDEEIDIFGSKDSPDVDIFGVTSNNSSVKQESNSPARKLRDISVDNLFANSARDATNNVEKMQNPKSKKISLFDDDDDIDDADLFGTKSTKKNVKIESRTPKDDDDNDLFSSMKTKNTNPGNVRMEPKVDSKANIDKAEGKSNDVSSGNGLFSNTADSHELVFGDDNYDDLFGYKSKNAQDVDESKTSVSETKKDAIPEELSVKNAEVTVSEPSISDSNKSTVVDESDPIYQNTSRTSEQIINEDGAATTAVENVKTAIGIESGTKKSPPKSLNIRTTVSSPPPEENSQAPRRSVSGKIKNLMGKMGNVKILSPMDTPPLWRRSEEKTDEEDNITDRDSDDGGSMSIQGQSSPPSISEDSAAQKQSLQSTISGESNVEGAISFDEPAQVETLSIAASKTRVRIQAKRRPQSRHARKSALRHSGIDFDAVDATESNLQDNAHNNELPNTFAKESFSSTNLTTTHVVTSHSDRLVSSTNESVHRISDSTIFLAADDKSELGSLSKESSMSANKNTLLSPSTDEEDLFDVPPDLPEDPQKEDTIFGRAPLLSPVEKILSEKVHGKFKPQRDTHIKGPDDTETDVESITEDNDSKKCNASMESNNDPNTKVTVLSNAEKRPEQDTAKSKEEIFSDESNKELIDPLRDSSHDPLKDPSQLFAFVTKTPSPEKGKNVLFPEDDSLFFSGLKKPREDSFGKKPILDLFADDTEGELFFAPASKPVKKLRNDTKVSLFDDDTQDDESDSLFGSVAKKLTPKVDTQKSQPSQYSQKKASLFEDDDENNDISLFSEQSEQSQKLDSVEVSEQVSKNEFSSSITESVKTSHITDIFGDEFGEEDYAFPTTSAPKKVVTSKSLFPSDDDDDDDDNKIFKKASTARESGVTAMNTRVDVTRKNVRRDLKKTAEKIGKDPLSILQED